MYRTKSKLAAHANTTVGSNFTSPGPPGEVKCILPSSSPTPSLLFSLLAPLVPCGVIYQRLTWGATPELIAADCSCELRFGEKQNYRLPRLTAKAERCRRSSAPSLSSFLALKSILVPTPNRESKHDGMGCGSRFHSLLICWSAYYLTLRC